MFYLYISIFLSILMNILTNLLFIVFLKLIPLSQCCSSTFQLHQKTIVIRRKNKPYDDLMFGSLLREDVVITAPNYLHGALKENIIVEANCNIISNKSDQFCIRRTVSEIIFENEFSVTDIDSIAILRLEPPFEANPVVQLTSLAKNYDEIDTYNCFYVKNQYYFSDRTINEAIFFYGSLTMDAFSYQSKIGKTTLVSRSAFHYLKRRQFKNKLSLYRFIRKQNHTLRIVHDEDQKYLGTAIYCSVIDYPEKFFQVGVANHLFVVSFKEKKRYVRKEMMYFINVVGREQSILDLVDRKKADSILTHDFIDAK